MTGKARDSSKTLAAAFTHPVPIESGILAGFFPSKRRLRALAHAGSGPREPCFGSFASARPPVLSAGNRFFLGQGFLP